MKYAVDFTDMFIVKLDNWHKSHSYLTYEQFDSFEEAKKSLLYYWEGEKIIATSNIQRVKNINENSL
jgi:hypothetical protein